MVNLLDKILLNTIFGHTKPQRFGTQAVPQPMQTDPFEKPSTYRGWLWLLKYGLASRYLNRKAEALTYFRLKGIFPIPQDEFLVRLQTILAGQPLFASVSPTPVTAVNYQLPRWTILLRAVIIYPLLLISLSAGVWAIKTHQDLQKLEQALVNHLIKYADLLHQNVGNRRMKKTETIQAVEKQAEIEKQQVLIALPNRDSLVTAFKTALSTLADVKKDAEEILAAFCNR
jgi:hypothetical protein